MDDQNNQPEKKQSLVARLGLGKQSVDKPLPENTSVSVGNKTTTLVGATSQSKIQKQGEDNSQGPKIPEEVLYEWQAPEFIYTQKPVGWYAGMVIFFLFLAAIAIYFQQWITVVLVAVMASAVGVWASRRPRVLHYQITNYGVVIDQRKYHFDDFRAYYTYMDYTQPSLDLVPAKRFGTLVSVPLATPEADGVEETIAHMIPKIDHKEDLADKLFRRLRF